MIADRLWNHIITSVSEADVQAWTKLLAAHAKDRFPDLDTESGVYAKYVLATDAALAAAVSKFIGDVLRILSGAGRWPDDEPVATAMAELFGIKEIEPAHSTLRVALFFDGESEPALLQSPLVYAENLAYRLLTETGSRIFKLSNGRSCQFYTCQAEGVGTAYNLPAGATLVGPGLPADITSIIVAEDACDGRDAWPKGRLLIQYLNTVCSNMALAPIARFLLALLSPIPVNVVLRANRLYLVPGPYLPLPRGLIPVSLVGTTHLPAGSYQPFYACAGIMGEDGSLIRANVSIKRDRLGVCDAEVRIDDHDAQESAHSLLFTWPIPYIQHVTMVGGWLGIECAAMKPVILRFKGKVDEIPVDARRNLHAYLAQDRGIRKLDVDTIKNVTGIHGTFSLKGVALTEEGIIEFVGGEELALPDDTYVFVYDDRTFHDLVVTDAVTSASERSSSGERVRSQT